MMKQDAQRRWVSGFQITLDNGVLQGPIFPLAVLEQKASVFDLHIDAIQYLLTPVRDPPGYPGLDWSLLRKKGEKKRRLWSLAEPCVGSLDKSFFMCPCMLYWSVLVLSGGEIGRNHVVYKTVLCKVVC